MFAAVLIAALMAPPAQSDPILLRPDLATLKVDPMLLLEAAVMRATHTQVTLVTMGAEPGVTGSGVRVIFDGRVGQNLNAGLRIEGSPGGLQVFYDVQVPTFSPAGELWFMSGLRKAF